MPGVSHSRVLSCARTDRETEHSVAKGRRSERERQQSGEEYCQYGEYRRIPWYEQFSSLSLSVSLLLLLSHLSLLFSHCAWYSTCFHLSFDSVPGINPNGECQYRGRCITTTTTAMTRLPLRSVSSTSFCRCWFVECFSAGVWPISRVIQSYRPVFRTFSHVFFVFDRRVSSTARLAVSSWLSNADAK